MTTKFLGKLVSKTTASFKVLDPIERGKASHLYGVDYWNAYEFIYLDDK
jgi:NADPH-dependent 7-cyano-7-deazaguanine reductase QueF-like protein